MKKARRKKLRKRWRKADLKATAVVREAIRRLTGYQLFTELFADSLTELGKSVTRFKSGHESVYVRYFRAARLANFQNIPRPKKAP